MKFTDKWRASKKLFQRARKRVKMKNRAWWCGQLTDGLLSVEGFVAAGAEGRKGSQGLAMMESGDMCNQLPTSAEMRPLTFSQPSSCQLGKVVGTDRAMHCFPCPTLLCPRVSCLPHHVTVPLCRVQSPSVIPHSTL